MVLFVEQVAQRSVLPPQPLVPQRPQRSGLSSVYEKLLTDCFIPFTGNEPVSECLGVKPRSTKQSNRIKLPGGFGLQVAFIHLKQAEAEGRYVQRRWRFTSRTDRILEDEEQLQSSSGSTAIFVLALCPVDWACAIQSETWRLASDQAATKSRSEAESQPPSRAGSTR